MTSNATWLFARPAPNFHNAEPWWTAWFSMLLLWGAVQGRPQMFPWCTTDAEGNLIPAGTVSFAGARYDTLVADARLRGEPFGIAEWPNDFLDLRPDLTFIRPGAARQVVFVETKTIGASVKGNVGRYAELVAWLEGQGWTAELYYLMSAGHEALNDWKLLAEAGARILRWEDVFEAAAETPFGALFGEPLANYLR